MQESMDGSAWKEFFSNWPPEMLHDGILVTSFNESIRFSGFMMGETLLLLQRRTPDSLGSRTVVLSYDNVAALKILEVVKPATFLSVGFQSPPPPPQKKTAARA